VPPEQLGAGCGLLLGEIIDDLVEVFGVLGEILALRTHVGVMEAVVGRAEQREEFEGDVGLELGGLHRVLEPGTQEGLAAEGVAARPCEGVPIGHRKAQMVFHAFAHDDLVRLVIAEGQRIGAVGAFVFHFLDIAEKSGAHVGSPWVRIFSKF